MILKGEGRKKRRKKRRKKKKKLEKNIDTFRCYEGAILPKEPT